MSKINILHIISNMNNGGAQKIILNYVNDLQNDKDIELSLLVLSSKNNNEYIKLLENYNVNVTYLDCFNKKYHNKFIQKLYEFYITNKKTQKFLLKNNPEIVHVHLFGTLMFCYKAIKKCHIPVKFYTLHSNPLRFNGIKLNILRKCFSNYNFIPICVTNEQVEIAKRHYLINKYETIHNGVDFKKIKNEIVSKSEARNIFGLNNDDFVICSVGRLDPIKKYDYLIKIFSHISKINDKSKLLIAGSGAELNNLKKIVSLSKLEDRIIFLGNVENTTQVYCAADVFSLTSESESASLVLLEAQTCGLKCVVSNGVPSESIITDKVIKMNKEASIDAWSNAILYGNNFEKRQFDFEDYEVHLMSKKMKDIYLKYWKEYQNEKQ